MVGRRTEEDREARVRIAVRQIVAVQERVRAEENREKITRCVEQLLGVVLATDARKRPEELLRAELVSQRPSSSRLLENLRRHSGSVTIATWSARNHRRYRDRARRCGSRRDLANAGMISTSSGTRRRRRPGFLIASGKFAADRGQQASGGRIVSVTVER